MEYRGLDINQLPDTVRPHVDPASPVPARMMAAKSLVPLKPHELLTALYCLLADTEPEVAQAAAASMGKLPDRILRAALAAPMDPAVLHFVGLRLPVSDPRRPVILQNPAVGLDTLEAMAANANLVELDILAANQRRFLQSPGLVRAMLQNPQISGAMRASILEFCLREGMTVPGVPELEAPAPPPEPSAELPEMPPLELAAKAFPDLPMDLLQQLPEHELLELAGTQIDEDMMMDTESEFMAMSPEQEAERLEKGPVAKRLMSMGVSQKIALAQKGNKEVRTILLRETNKLILMAVVASPRITDKEVVALSASRTMAEDVIRFISKKKDWIQLYTIRKNLVMNPKTPMKEALKFLTTLTEKDLKDVAKSKGVPAVVATNAKKLATAKQEKKNG